MLPAAMGSTYVGQRAARASSWGQLESLTTSMPASLRRNGVILRIRSRQRNVLPLVLWSCAGLPVAVTGISYYAARTAALQGYAQSSTRTRTCDRGFRDDGNSCVAVRLPLNASLVPSGHDWHCDAPFLKRHATCVAAQRHAIAPTDSDAADEDCGPDSTRQGSPSCAAHSPAKASSAIALLVLATLRSLPR